MPAGWVAAAGAAVSAGESIAGNMAAQSTANKNNASIAQVQGAQGSMLNQAESVAQQPFTPYTGTLTAPMSGNQQQAYGLASADANAQVGQQDNAAATGLVAGVGNSQWNQATEQQYANPYTQDVTNASLAAQNQSYLQSLAGTSAGQAQNNAIGGDRAAVTDSNLTAQNSMNTGILTADNNANAYNSAMNAWNSNNSMKLQAANAYESAGQDVTQMNNQDIQNLIQTGNISQVTAQTDLNNQYNQFTRQQGWSAQQLNSLINANTSAKGGSPALQTTAPQSNTANQLLGLGSTIAGLYGGSTNGSNYGTPPTVANSAPSSGFTNNINPSTTNPALTNYNFSGTPSIAPSSIGGAVSAGGY